MYPEIAGPFGTHLRSHVVLLVAAIASVHLLAPYWAKRSEGLSPLRTRLALIGLGGAAFLGGRLHFVANAWEIAGYAHQPAEALRFWTGLHAGGALLGLALGTPLVLRSVGLPLRRFLDTAVPAICVGIALARVGCFLNGCCFGRVCDAAFCLSFPSDSIVHGFHLRLGLAERTAWSLPIHPLPLYFAVIALGAASLGVWLEGRKSYDGQVALVVSASYLTFAALVEPLRADYYPPDFSWGGTLQFEWIAYALAATSLVALFAIEIRRRTVSFRHVTLLPAERLPKSRSRQ